MFFLGIIYLLFEVVDIERDLEAEGIEAPTPYLGTAKLTSVPFLLYLVCGSNFIF
jgi:hypothetical protein